jgi:uncharacterized protein YlaI
MEVVAVEYIVEGTTVSNGVRKLRVKCVICDKIESIENESFLAKRLRNRPIHTYTCTSCHDRITERTKARLATGKFRINKPVQEDDDW